MSGSVILCLSLGVAGEGDVGHGVVMVDSYWRLRGGGAGEGDVSRGVAVVDSYWRLR